MKKAKILEKVAEMEYLTELKRAIDLSNLVPNELRHFLPEISLRYEEFKEIEKTEFPDESEQAEFKARLITMQTIQSELGRFPKLYRYIFGDAETADDIEAMSRSEIFTIFKKYYDYYESRRLLRLGALFSDRYSFMEADSYAALPNGGINQTLSLFIENGRFFFPGSKILEILRNIVDVQRLRICPICKDIFWASRIGGKRDEGRTCPKKRCSDNYHQRKKRVKEYKAKLELINTKLKNEENNLKDQQQSTFSTKNSIKRQKKTVEELSKEITKLKNRIAKQDVVTKP